MDGGCKIKKETKHACKMFGLNNGKVGIAFPGKEKVWEANVRESKKSC